MNCITKSAGCVISGKIVYPFFLCTTTFEPFRNDVRRTKMRSQFLACLNGRPQEVVMSRHGQTRFVCIGKSLRCVLQTGVLRRHVSFKRPLRQTRNHSDAVFVSADSTSIRNTECATGIYFAFIAIFCGIYKRILLNQKAEVNMHALLSPLHFLLCIRNNIRLVFGRLYRLVLLCKKRTLFSEIATDRGI